MTTQQHHQRQSGTAYRTLIGVPPEVVGERTDRTQADRQAAQQRTCLPTLAIDKNRRQIT